MKQIAANKEIDNMDEREAYSNSFYEIFDTIYTIFGNY